MHRGSWNAHTAYQKGDEVWHGGSTWQHLSHISEGTEPGSSDAVWGGAGEAGVTHDKGLGLFIKTIEHEGLQAAADLLTNETFVTGLLAQCKNEAGTHFTKVWKEKETKYQGNYSYTKATHHALVSSINLLMAQMNARSEIEQMRNGLRDAEVRNLEDRIAELERSPLQYEGPFEAGKTYDKGTFVSFGGSLFHANRRTDAKPMQSHDWTLAVKRGRDSKGDSR